MVTLIPPPMEVHMAGGMVQVGMVPSMEVATAPHMVQVTAVMDPPMVLDMALDMALDTEGMDLPAMVATVLPTALGMEEDMALDSEQVTGDMARTGWAWAHPA